MYLNIICILLLLGFNIVLCYRLARLYSSVYIVRFLYIYYIIQILLSLLITAIDPDFLVPGHPIRTIRISDVALKYAFIVSILGIFIYVGVYVVNSFSQNRCIGFYERFIQISDTYYLNFLSKVMAVIFSLTILVAFIPSLPYVLRVVSLSFSFITLFIGIFYHLIDNRKLWIGLLLFNFIVQNVQGSRGIALIPIVLFIFGYLVSIYKTRYFRKKVVLFCLLVIPLTSLFGAIASFREMYGRGIDVNTKNISKMVKYVFSDDSEEKDTDNFLYGLSRLINHGDFAVIGLTPKPIPYREGDSFVEEIEFIFTLQGENGNKAYRMQRGSLNYGSGTLSKYGFSINEKTSTGLGLLGDSYSRFGILGVMIYFFAISVFLTLIEYKLSYFYRKKNKILSYLIFIFFLYTSLYTLYGNSYFLLLKKFLFNGSFVVICMMALNVLILSSKRRYNISKR